MTLDEEELEIVRLCLLRAAIELEHQIEGKGRYFPVEGMGKFACRHFRLKVCALLSRIEAGPKVGKISS